MELINIKFDRIEEEQNGKVKYKVDGRELFAEETVMYHYKQNGYNAIWSENNYWWCLLGLLFWDVIFAKVRGAVQISRGGIDEELYVDSPKFNELFQWTISTNGMPADFFTVDFYKNREAMVNNRIKELSNSNVESVLRQSYQKHHGQNFRMIENWNRFNIEELCIAPRILPSEAVIKILDRILRNISENRSGLPDLLVYNDSCLFMAEVKSEKDKLSEGQKNWIDFLESTGIRVELCLINHTERQIANLKKKEQESKKLVTVSFGNSTSKKRDEAIEFVKKQPTYFTSGEGKEQIHGAIFDVNEIETLYTILDLTSGWKSQRIEIDGKEVKSTELRSVLWCFREKNKQGASLDYCKQGRYDGDKNNFSCRMVPLDIDRWTEYGYISTDSGDWIFDKKELEEYKDSLLQNTSYCPLFDPKKVEKVFEKIPERINPIRDKDWAYISSEHNEWFNHNGKWYTTWGNTNFPGIAAMIGVCKMSRKEINEAIRDIKEEQKMDRYLSNSRVVPKPQKKSGCFIATAVYGGYDLPEVMTLRKFRDKTLNKNPLGRLFIRIYYRLSPPLADYIKNKEKLRKGAKSILDVIVKRLNDR